MDQHFIFKTLLFLIVSIAAQGQLFDFLTGIQSFIQPYPTRPIFQYDVTTIPKTDRHTSKPPTRNGSRRTSAQASRPKNKEKTRTTQNFASFFNFDINPTTTKPITKNIKKSSHSDNSKMNITESRISFPRDIAVSSSQNRRPWAGDTRQKLIFSPAPENDVTTKATREKNIIINNSGSNRNVNNNQRTINENSNLNNRVTNKQSKNSRNPSVSGIAIPGLIDNNLGSNTFGTSNNNNRRVDSGSNKVANVINAENNFVTNNQGTMNENNNHNNREINKQNKISRNPNVSGIAIPGVINNNLGSNTFGTSNNNRQPSNIDRETSNNNFGSNNNNFGSNSNNFGNTNTFTTQNPLLTRPGVKPAVVDVNRPPITNRPMTERPNYVVFGKPTDPGAITFTEGPDISPEIMIGPDEDRMSRQEKRRYIETAERMCDKYKSLSMRKVEAIPLVPSPSPVQVNISECTPITIPLVVGGKVVTIRDFPHMALLGWRKIQEPGYSWKCGGSLISDQFVLTAGHCSYQEKDNSVITGTPRAVQLGSTYLDDIGAVVVQVLSVTRHPKYKLPMNYYDIALLKLVTKVTFSEVIRPACLGVPPPAGEPIIATGWGRTEFGGDQSMELRSVSLPVWDIQECYNVLGTSRKLPNGPMSDNQMCAGEKRGGKDTCQGDSGGPAQIQDGCAWRVVAVTSLGRSCGAAYTPGLYALVHRAFVSAVAFKQENSNRDNGNRNVNNGNRNNNNGNSNDNNYYRGVIDINNRNSNTPDNASNNHNNNHGGSIVGDIANNRDTYEPIIRNENNYGSNNNYGNNNDRILFGVDYDRQAYRPTEDLQSPWWT